jgi:tetratricopeptide (TPR) repeat protein
LAFFVVALAAMAGAFYLSDYYTAEQRRLAAAGDPQGAIDASRLAVRFDPFDTDALEARSFLLQQQRQYNQAAGALREAIRRDPNNYLTHLMLANLQLTQLDDLDSAIESYREVLRLNPQSSVARNSLAQALVRRGDLDAAETEYEELAERRKISTQGLYDLGRIYVRTGKPEEGLRIIKRARRQAEAAIDGMEGPLKRQQQQAVTSMDLAIADALVVLGRYDEAREVIEASSSAQAPALLQLLDSDPEGYRQTVVNSEIY